MRNLEESGYQHFEGAYWRRPEPLPGDVRMAVPLGVGCVQHVELILNQGISRHLNIWTRISEVSAEYVNSGGMNTTWHLSHGVDEIIQCGEVTGSEANLEADIWRSERGASKGH